MTIAQNHAGARRKTAEIVHWDLGRAPRLDSNPNSSIIEDDHETKVPGVGNIPTLTADMQAMVADEIAPVTATDKK